MSNYSVYEKQIINGKTMNLSSLNNIIVIFYMFSDCYVIILIIIHNNINVLRNVYCSYLNLFDYLTGYRCHG